MAKDVVTFLNWAAEPEHDVRKQYGIKAVILFSTLFCLSLYVKRFKWGVIKNRKICEYLHRLAERVLTLVVCSLQPSQSSLDYLVRSYIIECFVVFGIEYFPRLSVLPACVFFYLLLSLIYHS
jgi:hypothetical protein